MFVSSEERVVPEGDGRWELTSEDEAFPESVRDLEDLPKVLYGMGSREVLQTRCLAIIGARRATPYGLAVAEMAGRVAAECGITVVSGGALGCDAAALRGAQRAGGATIVVPGTGVDQIYPKSSTDVFEGALKHGCVVGLERWGTPPSRYGFPKRNRLIAALAEALLVTEAGERSGTSSTAAFAIDLNRTLYSVPGCIFSPESVGANKLIVDGALPIVSEEDLEMRISLDFGVMRLVGGGAQRRDLDMVVSALAAMPMRPDDLANRLGKSALSTLRKLAELEASGFVTRLPDGRYAPSRKAFLAEGEG